MLYNHFILEREQFMLKARIYQVIQAHDECP